MMPLYEYACGSCAKRFERLMRSANGHSVACPGCGSVNVTRAVSTFAAFSAGVDGVRAVSGGGCCGGAGGGCACAR